MNFSKYTPSYLIEDCRRPETGLYLAPNWTIKVDGGFMSLFHESVGVISVDCEDPTSTIIECIAKGGATVADAMTLAESQWLSILLSLWQKGVVRLDDGGIHTQFLKSATPSRYIWFEEYLRTYAGPSKKLEQMLKALADAKVCVIGLGGLGATLSLSLAASGVGRLRLVDGDVIEESNLPRQILYSETSIGQKKVSVLRNAILANNSATRVDTVDEFVASQDEAHHAVEDCDFVILCADEPRLAIRNWVGKACFENKIPSIAMAGQWIGPITVPGESPCHACVGRFHGSRISDAAGFLRSTAEASSVRASFGPRPLILAGFMSSAVIHYLTGIDRETLLNRRFQVDIAGHVQEEHLVRYRNCIVCGGG
ncbi:conserved hypothetical protein [Cupriavidus taiwanensis]|uniref:HesA/MoeB/ThiF family protein n=1 Tax=Cupriavidus taiwanensis TaxID=164546 RepID=UPI000E127F41|nr:ThiF family adenylyltransferase [Cupriavidus taiwanensis]SOZ19090.1 conserved hypothetical protein [Cupriavidus taiwanensis]SOZ32311.1 conserved hypothetical protein [Cupriavidus taiwanensis]SOZ47904.1 conserved hypothetical protein [Cupriavidus taiwanensis]